MEASDHAHAHLEAASGEGGVDNPRVGSDRADASGDTQDPAVGR